jgi:tyrosine-protein phosphatase SIW14
MGVGVDLPRNVLLRSATRAFAANSLPPSNQPMTNPNEEEPAATVHRRRWRRTLAGLLVLAALAYGVNHLFWHFHLKRFQVVREGVFYRAAQPSEFGMRRLVRRHGVKTVVSVQLYDFRLYSGLWGLGAPDGHRESQYVAMLGAHGVQWPMGDEAYWPWPTPWQFEEFFKLLDDPANWPVAVHCQGGRHRTGTLAALFRLEYDRWPADRALAEMYSFKFGMPIRLQEHNLRTYLPRPRPSTELWEALARRWRGILADESSAGYDALVRSLRLKRNPKNADDAVNVALAADLDHLCPFALPLAQRLIDEPDDALASPACLAAEACLDRTAQIADAADAPWADWSAAASLIADFGDPRQQARLLELLASQDLPRMSHERFDAVVAGVTNRYTTNRIAFLRPLVEQEAHYARQGAQQYRYCDTAVARLSTIIDRNLPDMTLVAGKEGWELARQLARDWFAGLPAEARLARLQPPSGNNAVRSGDPIPQEDLSKLRR